MDVPEPRAKRRHGDRLDLVPRPVGTTPGELAGLHQRFPVLLDNDEDIALWLGETGAPMQEIKTLVRVYDGEMIFEEEKKDPPPAKAKHNDDQPSLF